MDNYDETTVVIGMLSDKQIASFVSILADAASRWITCTVEGPRAASAAELAGEIRASTGSPVAEATAPADALALAARLTPCGQRILVCGSFRVVGPALEWLGLY